MSDESLKAEEIFLKAVGMGCSDIHIKPGSPPKMRLHGHLVAIPGFEHIILNGRQTDLLAAQTMDSHALASFQHNKYNFDYSFELNSVGRFRMNAFRTRGSVAIVGRLLQSKPKTLDELGVPSIVKKLAKSKSGIIIVSGATGSGKSSTMAGIIDLINNTKPVNIISIEDPIEIVHTDAMASIAQREIGVDVLDFESALSSALREDPDVILVGEVRNLETMKTVLTAADTGHLVITTLHTTNTAEAINRIVTLFPSEERDNTRRALASVLRGIVGQRLVPNLRGDRSVVNEVLLNTPEMADAILNQAPTTEIKKIIEKNYGSGMQTFEQAFVELIENGSIDLNTAKENTSDPEYYDSVEFKSAIKKAGPQIGLPQVRQPIGSPPKLPLSPLSPLIRKPTNSPFN